MIKPIPYGRQQILDEDIAEVVNVLKSDFLTQGPKVLEFEQNFAAYVGSDYAIAVSNGTAALHLSALSLNIEPGDRWITSPITFAASANAISYCGGNVEFVDIDLETGLIDLSALRTKLESKPIGHFKGIVIVHYSGLCVDMEQVRAIANQYNLKIIEDASHVPGGYFLNKKGERKLAGNGEFADLSTFSFHPVKHIAAGEGGMITTSNPELAKKTSILRTHGITKDPQDLFKNDGDWYYEMQTLGFNYRLSDIHSALGISQLRRIDTSIKKRQILAKRYFEKLSNLASVELLHELNKTNNVYHLFLIKAKNRKELYNHLRQHQIYCQVHYIPLHQLPYYRRKGSYELPKAELFYDHCLSIPLYPDLSEDEQDFVIEKIYEFDRQ
ncbi:MAG: UDP-4-amino-4,6-dideoxy-N-acetyl-beta-L-altrosamine transaminase [Cyclobacteriaceae bacterium]